MKAAVVTGPNVIEITTVPDPSPAADGVVVEVAATGLCGTDLLIVAGNHGELPVIPGHEVSGTVVAVGADSAGFAVGDRVVVDPNLPCGSCRPCLTGRTNLCTNLRALGVSTAGGAAELMAAPRGNVVRVPDELDLVVAALAEPLSCAIHAFDILRARPGVDVLLYGARTMGLMLLALARRSSVARVDVVELDAERRAVATHVGADRVAETAAELDQPEGWDIVIDATGAVAAISDGLQHVATGGTFLQFGVPPHEATVPVNPYEIYRREITITGSMAVLNSLDRAVALLADEVLEPDVFVTHRARLDDYATALAEFGAGNGIKTLVLPSR